jgi:hypothetical protein
MAYVKLGRKLEPIPSHIEPESAEGKEFFPELFLDDVVLDKLPDEGEAIIKFKVVRQTKDLKTGKQNVVLEVREIGDYSTPEKAADGEANREDEFERLAQGVMKKMAESDE